MTEIKKKKIKEQKEGETMVYWISVGNNLQGKRGANISLEYSDLSPSKRTCHKS